MVELGTVSLKCPRTDISLSLYLSHTFSLYLSSVRALYSFSSTWYTAFAIQVISCCRYKLYKYKWSEENATVSLIKYNLGLRISLNGHAALHHIRFYWVISMCVKTIPTVRTCLVSNARNAPKDSIAPSSRIKVHLKYELFADWHVRTNGWTSSSLPIV